MARTYRTTLRCTNGAGTLFEPTLHYQTDLTFIGDEPSPSDVAAGVNTLLGTAFRACFTSAITLHEVIVAEEVLPPAVGTGGAHTVELAGTLPAGTGNQLPDGASVVINRHTETRSRSARGWLHLPSPLWSSQLAGNVWQNSYVAICQNFADLLDNSFDLGTVDITHVHPVVYSRTRHQRGQTPYTFRVTSATANHSYKFLRSRQSTP